MPDVDFIEEIRIAQYWRKQLGEYEYVYYNPDDLRRWFIALENRGPQEIRDYLNERAGRHPEGMVTGIVSVAPHPPRAIVDLWLSSHDRTRTSSYWIAMAIFTTFCFVAIPYLHGCATLQNVNRVATRPPQMSPPLQPGQFGPPPNAPATLPNPGPPPTVSTASPPTGGGTHH